MKYSIDKYLLLEAAQDVAALKSAHKTKVAELEPKNSTDELGEKLNNGTFKHETITEAAATAQQTQQTQPNHFQRNGGKYAAAAGVATGAGAYAYNNPEQTHQQMSSIAQKGQELYNSGKDVVQNKMNGLQSAIEQQANKVGTQSGDLKNIQSATHELINNPQRVQQELQSIAVPDAPAVTTQTQAVPDVQNSVATSPLPNASTLKMIQKESNVPYGPTETGDDFRLRALAGLATPDEMRNFVKYDPKGFQQFAQDRVALTRPLSDDHKVEKKEAESEALRQKKEASYNEAQAKMDAAKLLNKKFQDNAAKKLADSEELMQKKEAEALEAQSRINAAKLLHKKFQDNQNSVPSVEHHEHGY